MSAPMTEFKVLSIVRKYERVKLTLMSCVLVIVSLMGGYTIGLVQNTRASLTLLSCAVSREVQVAGPPNSEAQRTAFDACVKRGGPRHTE